MKSMPQEQKQRVSPGRFELLLHWVKGLRLIKELIFDPQIHIGRKLLFLVLLGFIITISLFPDIWGEAILSVVLPVIGTILGIPLDFFGDWIVISLFFLVKLLEIFPSERVEYHYHEVFKK